VLKCLKQNLKHPEFLFSVVHDKDLRFSYSKNILQKQNQYNTEVHKLIAQILVK
jgi:hypothetical protein